MLEDNTRYGGYDGQGRGMPQWEIRHFPRRRLLSKGLKMRTQTAGEVGTEAGEDGHSWNLLESARRLMAGADRAQERGDALRRRGADREGTEAHCKHTGLCSGQGGSPRGAGSRGAP